MNTISDVKKLLDDAYTWYTGKSTLNLWNPFVLNKLSNELLACLKIVNNQYIYNDLYGNTNSKHLAFEKRFNSEMKKRGFSSKNVFEYDLNNIFVSDGFLYVRNSEDTAELVTNFKELCPESFDANTIIQYDKNNKLLIIDIKSLPVLKIEDSEFDINIFKLTKSLLLIHNTENGSTNIDSTFRFFTDMHMFKHYFSKNIRTNNGTTYNPFEQRHNSLFEMADVLTKDAHYANILNYTLDANMAITTLMIPFLTNSKFNVSELQLTDGLTGIEKTLSIYISPDILKPKFEAFRLCDSPEALYHDLLSNLDSLNELNALELPTL